MENSFVIQVILLTVFEFFHSHRVLGDAYAELPCDEIYECCTPQCFTAAKLIIESMNKSVEPCDDFYEFVCGNYKANITVDNEQKYLSRFKDMQAFVNDTFFSILHSPIEEKDSWSNKVMKQIHSSCMDEEKIVEESIESLLVVLKSLGDWPVLSGKWKEEGYSLYQQLVNATLLGPQKAFLFNVELTRSEIFLQSFNPILELSDLCKGLNNTKVRAYHEYIVAIVTALGGNKTTAIREMLDVVKLEYDIAKIYCHPGRVDLTNFIKDIILFQNKHGGIKVSENEMKEYYLTVKFENLDEMFPGFPWSEFMNVTLADIYTVGGNDEVVVSEPYGLIWTAVLMNSASKRTLSNLVLWRVVHNLIPALNATIRDIRFKFSATIGKKDDMFETRQYQCLKLLRPSFSGVLVSSILNNVFTPNYKKKAIDLMSKMKNQLIENAEHISWINATEKKHAIAKAKAIVNEFIVPQQLDDYEPTLKALHKLQLNNLNFIQMLMKLLRYNVIRRTTHRKRGIRYEKLDLFGGLGEAMEFYNQVYRTMSIPAGYFMEVLFNINRTSFLDFGGMGIKVAHCMGHIYDEDGLWYSYGSGAISWSDITSGKQQEVMDCLKEQYSNITVEQVGKKIDGTKTLHENFADNFSLKVAYDAFIKWSKETSIHKRLPGLNYPLQKMFWIQFASSNCEKLTKNYAMYETVQAFKVPRKYRVNTPLGNSMDFRNDWNCSSNTKMGSQKICDVW